MDSRTQGNVDRCPHCTSPIKITQESIGKIVHCPTCHNSIFIPGDYNSPLKPFRSAFLQKTSMNIGFSVAHPTKNCWNCGKPILEVADRCKYCHYLQGKKFEQLAESNKNLEEVQKASNRIAAVLAISCLILLIVMGILYIISTK